jgi:hypothetical protein
MEALGERMYSSYSFMTSALDGESGQRHAPATLYPVKGAPVPIWQETGWAPEPVWTQRLQKNPLYLPGIEPKSPSCQFVVRDYTDWATPVPEDMSKAHKIINRQPVEQILLQKRLFRWDDNTKMDLREIRFGGVCILIFVVYLTTPFQ